MNQPELLAIDVETGGLIPGYHALLSLAAVPTWDQAPFSVLIWPDPPYEMDEKAKQVCGYSLDLWRQRGAVGLGEAITRFDEWLAAAPIPTTEMNVLAHNAGFDRAFVLEAYRHLGRRAPLTHRWRCSQAAMAFCMDAGALQPGSCSLNALCGLTGQERPQIHDALADARACLLGYCWLLRLPEGLRAEALTPSLN